jgi:hypothetical protein
MGLLATILLGGSLGLLSTNAVDAGEVCSPGHCAGVEGTDYFKCGTTLGSDCCCPKKGFSECCDQDPAISFDGRRVCCTDKECCKFNKDLNRRVCVAKVACAVPRLLPGSPTRVEIEAQQTTNGIGSISVVKEENVTVDIPPFTVGTIEPVITTATKITEGVRSVVELSMCTPEECCVICDPVLISLIRYSGQPIVETYTDVPQTENKVTIKNGAPGLKHLRIQVNGKKFEVVGLADNEELTLDISSALVIGNKNTIVLMPLGKPGGTSTILIHD